MPTPQARFCQEVHGVVGSVYCPNPSRCFCNKVSAILSTTKTNSDDRDIQSNGLVFVQQYLSTLIGNLSNLIATHPHPQPAPACTRKGLGIHQ